MPTSDTNDTQVAHLRATLKNQSSGGLIMEARTRLPPEDQQTEFLERHFPAATYPLFEVNAELAASILCELWRESMAYHIEMMPAAQAHTLASQFLALFGSDARYWSNHDLPHTIREEKANGTIIRLGDSLPLTGATFDGGVLVVGAQQVGILWVEDED